MTNRKSLKAHCFIFCSLIVLLASCTSVKNTGGTRWYHAFNTRYNIYFNGEEAYKEALKNQFEAHEDVYSEMILMYPVSALPKDKPNSGGPFDKAIEKSVKAIKRHSIQTKPDKQSGKRSDPKYQAFMSRTEYNPFLHNAWMMMAESQFYNGDFLQAASSFSYISRLYETQPEIAVPAKIWKARCYSEMEWFYEAEDLLSKINNGALSKSESNWFSAVYADHLIKRKQYANAIPYLQIAIKSEKNGYQRTREKYLLGQIYTTSGQKDMAYKLFGEISSTNAPYILELNAKIRQTEVFPGGDINKMGKKLTKMTKSSKNKEYLDQIYYAMGNIYMTVPDTTKAIESYEAGVEKSTRNGFDKVLNQVQLGDIYFTQRKYMKAQPNYAEALSLLKKEDKAFPRVSKRSEVLDELVIHAEAVELQDSLQRLSRMTEAERLQVVNKIIDDLIKKEKEEKEKSSREEYANQQEELRAQQQGVRPTQTPTIAPPSTESDGFYFYNTQAVALGKNAFQQKWGRRKLEDDWRRRTKSNPMSDLYGETNETDNQPQEEEVAADSLKNENPELAEVDADIAQSADPKDPQFYLQQIPVTEEDIAASDLIIADGLFHIGVIYKDLLEDNDLAIETFETLDTRFPENENKLEAYHYTYLIYWQEGNMEMANVYKSRIRELFPESDLAIAMADPDYERNLEMMNVIQDSLYRKTYQSYMTGDVMEIRHNYETVSSKYNQSKLMPQFMFLNALSFVQTNEADTFKVLLKELIDKYPAENVSVLAGEMMKGFQRGLLLAASGDNMLARGGLFNIRFGGAAADSLGLDSTIVFTAEKNTPHELLLVYPKGNLNDNMLLFAVASFNFGNFMVNDFDLEKTEMEEVGMLKIKGFNNQDEVIQYIRMIHQPAGYAQDIGQSVIILPISLDNYEILMKGKSMDEYMHFFEANFAEGNENLIAGWRLKQTEEMETHALPEPVTDSLPEVKSEKPETPETPETEIKKETEPEIKTEPEVQDTEPEKPLTPVEESPDVVNDVYNKASEELQNATNVVNEIATDPVRGILNLFKKKKSTNPIDDYVKQQQIEEKEKEKKSEKERKEKEKVDKELAKKLEKEKQEQIKKQDAEEKTLLKAKVQQEKDLANLKETEKKQKDAEKKRLTKEKEDARKDALKKKKAEQKAKEKLRVEEQKQKEKVRETERKAKEKAREEERKAKEKARKEKSGKK